MIGLRDFSKLKLKMLFPDRSLHRVWLFQYLGKQWRGDTYIFSHALQLLSNPFVTKSIAISVDELSKDELKNIVEIIGVDFSRLSTEEDCKLMFGEPFIINIYCDDRRTCVYFRVAGPLYEVGFTILNTGGLVFLTIDTFDVAIRQEECLQNALFRTVK